MEQLLERAKIPFEDVDLAVWPVMGEAEEEAAERFTLALLIGGERDARVEVPANDETRSSAAAIAAAMMR